jgi:hypothetical protein
MELFRFLSVSGAKQKASASHGQSSVFLDQSTLDLVHRASLHDLQPDLEITITIIGTSLKSWHFEEQVEVAIRGRDSINMHIRRPKAISHNSCQYSFPPILQSLVIRSAQIAKDRPTQKFTSITNASYRTECTS